MPVCELNNYYRIEELEVNHDSGGYYLTCRLIHCKNWVLCISEKGPIIRKDLNLTEQELSRLYGGEVLHLPEKGCTLLGVSSNVFVGGPRYRNAMLKPPAYVQSWCMNADGSELYVPDSADRQCVMVPVEYSYLLENGKLLVKINEVSGYHDSDLLYQVGDHLPIPLPQEWLNEWIPLRTTSGVCVFPAKAVQSRYKQVPMN